LDLNLLVASSSAVAAVGAILFTGITTWLSRKSKPERDAAALQMKRAAARMEAQEEEIAVNAAREAVRILRGELNEANNADVRRRETIAQQNERIDQQGRVIRRQNVRIELQHEEIGALRKWIAAVKKRLFDAGINGLPDVPRATDVTADEIWPEDV
jgi:hypothetical protein